MMIKNWSGVTTPSGTVVYADEIGTVLMAWGFPKLVSTATVSANIIRNGDSANKNIAFASGWFDDGDTWLDGASSTAWDVNTVLDQSGNGIDMPAYSSPIALLDRTTHSSAIFAGAEEFYTSEWFAATSDFTMGVVIDHSHVPADYDGVFASSAGPCTLYYEASSGKYYAGAGPTINFLRKSGLQVITMQFSETSGTKAIVTDGSTETTTAGTDATISVAGTDTYLIGRLTWGALITAKLYAIVVLDGLVADDLHAYLKGIIFP